MARTAFALLGPTASGKSRLAMAVAQKLPVEIVSVDSALVYRGMDIGTAKPGSAERARVPHHLIDLIDPDQSYSTGRFRSDAIRAVTEILARNHIPLLVGGTMLYYRSLAAGLDALPAANASVRGEIDAEARQRGWPALHAALEKIDPKSASRIQPTDAQRIQRALEVWRMTGKPLSALQGAAKPSLPFELKACALYPERSTLHQRIAARFGEMLRAGLVDEVRDLRNHYRLSADMPSMRAVGYRQVWRFLDNEIDHAAMREQAIAATRQLAKRQFTWLRSFPGLVRLDAGGAEDAVAALHLLLEDGR